MMLGVQRTGLLLRRAPCNGLASSATNTATSPSSTAAA